MIKCAGSFLMSFTLLLFSLWCEDLYGAFDSDVFNQRKGPLKILRINPSGEDVPSQRQIVFTFSRPVVPIGRMEREASEIPIAIEPKLECEWRWLDTASLSCNLSEKNRMTLATRYTVTISPGIKTEDGATTDGAIIHTFITQRPKITYAFFNTWTAPGMPQIRVNFDQPVSRASVNARVFFKTSSGLREPSIASAIKKEEEEETGEKTNSDTAYSWNVRPISELSLDDRTELWVEPGLASPEGKERGIENRVAVEFYTFPEFKFLGVRCTDSVTGQQTTHGAGLKNMLAFGKCDPLAYVELLFSAPVIKEEIKDHLTFTPDLRGGRTDYDPWDNVYSYSRLNYSRDKDSVYPVHVPEALKANKEYRVQAAPNAIKDEFGRPLEEAVDFTFKTDHRTPDLYLSSNYFVLEKNLNTEAPLIITNIEQLTFDYKTVTSKGLSPTIRKTVKLDDVKDVSYKIPLKTRELIGQPSGAVYAAFSTIPAAKNNDYGGRWFFSQVTPFNVQVKAGHFNTVVWVTDLSTGNPVKDVTVDIYMDYFLSMTEGLRSLSAAKTDSNGIAMLSGTEKLDPTLNIIDSYDDKSQKLFVRCRKGEDFAIVPLVGEFKVGNDGYGRYYDGEGDYEDGDYYRSYEAHKRVYGHMRAWGATAQGIYKAGDTVQFKIYVRNEDNKGLIAPPQGVYSLEAIDPMDKTVYEKKNITLSNFGSFDGEFIVPKTGAVGWYRFRLKSDFTDYVWSPLSVLISDFTPAPFKVLTDLNGDLFKKGDNIKVTTSGRLHAGGPYTNALARVTATLQRKSFMPKDKNAQGFNFDVYDYRGGEETIYQSELKLDDKGDVSNEFTMDNTAALYGTLIVESAVRDDRGKYYASQASAVFAGRDRYVGIKQDEWVMKTGDAARVKVAVVDENGAISEGNDVNVAVEYRKTTASRVKGSGNAYITQYNHEWVKVAECAVKSSKEASDCAFTPAEPGAYKMTASVKDTKGNPHASNLSGWAVGKGLVLWETPPDNSLNIFPEKTDYAIGEKARFLVQNPFPGGKALITIERYGVIASWVETFNDSAEIIEFPVKPEYLPGYYLSVVVTSPRVDKPLGENEVDLGKPSFKMGYATVGVKDPYKELVVDVKPEKETYRPRDKVKIGIQGRTGQTSAGAAQPPMEFAVAVLDEAVFDLLTGGRNNFDPYRGFYKLGPKDLRNYSILMQLVGRQKFEKKGANAGGDGGYELSMRSVFKFLTYWNPSLKPDSKGNASIEFELPDNLTGWKVLVMAVTETDRMGLGEGIFKVNRPTEVRAALPNQVLEGDSFEAGFTVMNRTGSARALNIAMSAEGSLADGTAAKTQIIAAEPYKRNMLWLPVKTKGGGEVKFKVIAGDSLDKDGLEVSMPVLKRASFEVGATYGTTTSPSVTESMEFPKDIRTDTGRVSVSVSPSVIGNVEGAFSYMQDYPYMCWEQKLTKGVMAAHYKNLKSYLSDAIIWPGSEGLAEATLLLAAEHQAPNGGMVYYVPEDRYVSPYLSAYTAIAFNWLRKSGYSIPGDVEERLHGYLLEMLKRDVMPDFYSKGMASTVRAVALAALTEHKKISRNDLVRYRQYVPDMSLFGKAHFLLALMNTPGTEDMRPSITDMILAHAGQTGGKFIFSETLDAAYERIHATNLRDNCSVLSALLSYSETTQGAAATGDVPFKLVRTITRTRGGKTHWENTQENMFCMNSLIDYGRAYEKEKPLMTVKAWLDSEKIGEKGFSSFRDKETSFDRSINDKDPGRKAEVRIEREGSGRLYYSAKLFYAPLELKADEVNSGIEAHREYSVERNGKWAPLPRQAEIKTGEIVKIDLYVSLPAARNFVVVDDPVPGGLEPVNSDLANTSMVDAAKGDFQISGGSFYLRHDDWREFGYSFWSFYHKELRHNAARFYSEYLDAGNYHLSYTAQAIAPGEFTVMPLRAEEMYDQDVYGKSFPQTLRVIRAEDAK